MVSASSFALIRLLSGVPLSDHISYYFYAILADKGGNGEALVEDAWFRHDDLFGSGVAGQIGQFQISDLMFPRETRMTFQDFPSCGEWMESFRGASCR
jgi:hypothetical protein